MNSLKFKTILEFDIRKKVITHVSVEELIKSGKKRSLFFDKNIYTLLQENYELIIENRCDGMLNVILDTLLREHEMEDFVLSKMVYNIMQAEDYELNNMLYRHKEWKKYIEENIEYFIENLEFEKIYVLYKNKNMFSENILRLLNEYLFNHKKEFIKSSLFSKFYKKYELTEKDALVLTEVIEKILDEVLLNEEVKMIDINIRNSGAYSSVIEVGDKIIKVGINRQTYNIPYDERILVPLIRVDLSKISSIKGTIEVSEKVDTNIKLEEWQLYQLYKEMRNRGVCCADLKNSNVGKLIKSNKKHWNKRLSDDLSNQGIITRDKDIKELPAGKLVIIDTDYIYDMDDENKVFPSGISERFEKRYLKRFIKNKR